MEGGTHEQFREVQLWLEQLFAGEGYPQYELKTRTVQILHQLMQKNQAENRDALLIIDDLTQKAEEYKAAGERLGSTLGMLGLVPGNLSQSGTSSLRTLASLALLLQVKQPSDSYFLLALGDLHHQMAVAQNSLRAEQRFHQHILSKTKSALFKQKSLLKAYGHLEDQAVVERPQVEQYAQQAHVLRSKCREYKTRLQTQKETLVHSGAAKSLYHSVLVRKSEDLSEVAKKIENLQHKLQSYHDLPPDISLTRVKIEALKLEEAKLEEELSKKIDAMHM